MVGGSTEEIIMFLLIWIGALIGYWGKRHLEAAGFNAHPLDGTTGELVGLRKDLANLRRDIKQQHEDARIIWSAGRADPREVEKVRNEMIFGIRSGDFKSSKDDKK